MTIAAHALYARMNGVWGTITKLADDHHISRTFVYSLANTLKDVGQSIFAEAAECVSALSSRQRSLQVMLALRLETCGSIGAISTVMDRFGCELSSTGSISQTLSRIGGLLPQTLSTANGSVRYLVFASDEIFAKQRPILVTVDPCSSAIIRIELADSRKAEDWKNHFLCLYDNGVQAIYLVSDEGQGLCAGHAAVLGDIVRQSDTYHAIAHQLGSWGDRLEKAAYKAIAEEHDGERKLACAKSAPVQAQRLAHWEQAAAAANQAASLYDDFSDLYRCVNGELNVFDRNGHLRDRQQAEEGVNAGLELLAELGHNAINEAVSKIRRTLPNLLCHFDVAKEVVNACQQLPICDDSLRAYCIAWQWGKAVRKAKKSARKNIAKEREQFCLEIAEALHEHEWGEMHKEVYSRLDTIVQSSAMVECINSIIRPYLNTTKNHVTQELLNLIMYYHNHRRYRDGVRKGKTPMEILTKTQQTKDWIESLFDVIREKDPELLLA